MNTTSIRFSLWKISLLVLFVLSFQVPETLANSKLLVDKLISKVGETYLKSPQGRRLVNRVLGRSSLEAELVYSDYPKFIAELGTPRFRHLAEVLERNLDRLGKELGGFPEALTKEQRARVAFSSRYDLDDFVLEYEIERRLIAEGRIANGLTTELENFAVKIRTQETTMERVAELAERVDASGIQVRDAVKNIINEFTAVKEVFLKGVNGSESALEAFGVRFNDKIAEVFHVNGVQIEVLERAAGIRILPDVGTSFGNLAIEVEAITGAPLVIKPSLWASKLKNKLGSKNLVFEESKVYLGEDAFQALFEGRLAMTAEDMSMLYRAREVQADLYRYRIFDGIESGVRSADLKLSHASIEQFPNLGIGSNVLLNNSAIPRFQAEAMQAYELADDVVAYLDRLESEIRSAYNPNGVITVTDDLKQLVEEIEQFAKSDLIALQGVNRAKEGLIRLSDIIEEQAYGFEHLSHLQEAATKARFSVKRSVPNQRIIRSDYATRESVNPAAKDVLQLNLVKDPDVGHLVVIRTLDQEVNSAMVVFPPTEGGEEVLKAAFDAIRNKASYKTFLKLVKPARHPLRFFTDGLSNAALELKSATRESAQRASSISEVIEVEFNTVVRLRGDLLEVLKSLQYLRELAMKAPAF